MKKIATEWVETSYNTDNFLSILLEGTRIEVAQLRKGEKLATTHEYSCYQKKKRNWRLHPTRMTDKELNELFGPNWYNETYSGFETVEKFMDWVRSKLCL